MGQNRSKQGIIGQNDSSPKTVPKRPKNGQKKGTEMVPKWSQNGPKMVLKWFLKWSKNGPKMLQKWS